MNKLRCVYGQQGDAWFGYFETYPDYWTQADSFDSLLDHLKDLHADLISGELPGVRRVGELILS